jgi:hypothetical protein
MREVVECEETAMPYVTTFLVGPTLDDKQMLAIKLVKISYQVPEIIPLYGLGVASPFLVAAG